MLSGVFIFVTVTLGIIACHQLLSNLRVNDEKTFRRRMNNAFPDRGASHRDLFKGPQPHKPVSSTPLLSESEMAKIAARGKPARELLATTALVLQQSGIKATPVQLTLMTLTLQSVLGIAGFMLAGFWGVLLGLAVGAVPVPAFVYRNYHSRREKMLSKLPEAFELMARVLRSGMSIPQALQAVSETAEPPLADEFARCFHQLNMGLSPETVFEEMARRTPLVEMRIFLMALAVQRQAGGKLSDVLNRLGELNRARIRLRRQVKTLTAEGRLQGRVLLVLPFVMFAVLMVINRSYAMILLEQHSLLAASGIAMLVGIVWIRRIVCFDI